MDREIKRILFIYNPFSGKALIKNYLYDILQELIQLDAEIVIHPTREAMEAYGYIKDHASEYDMIVRSGGDGTLNETVSGIMKCGGDKPVLGYIPSGSTNDFAASIGISKNMRTAAHEIVTGKCIKIDVGRFNDRYFTYVAAIGAFTNVSYATPQNMKNMLGHQAYIIEAMKQLTVIKPMSIIVETEKGRVEGEFIYGMITNSKSVGGVKGISGKNVDMRDNEFEITFIRKPLNPMHFNNIVSALLLQDYKGDTVYFDHVNKVKVYAKDQQIPWVIDGEFGGNLREVNIVVEHEALEIMVPDN